MNDETLHAFSYVLHILIISFSFEIMMLKIIICIVLVILYFGLNFFLSDLFVFYL